MKPMLATPCADPGDLLTNDRWCAEVKFDGRRLLAGNLNGKIVGYGRDGQLAGVPDPIFEQLSTLSTDILLDGELVDDCLNVFDIIIAGSPVTSLPSSERRTWMENLMQAWQPEECIELADRRVGPAKAELMEQVLSSGLEGVVFKRLDAPYEPGKSRAWMKHRFQWDIDVVIMARHIDKASFDIGVFDDDDNLVKLSSVSALTGDGPTLRTGDVVTITVAGRSKSGNLLFPVLPRKRTDKAAHECTIDQVQVLRAVP